MAFFDETTINNPCIQKDNYCYVKAAGIVNPDPRYVITRENSSTTVFAYIISGKMHMEIKNKEFTLLPGDCYIIPSKIYSKVYSDIENPASMIWVNCQGILIDELFKIYFDSSMPVVSTCNIEPQLKKIMNTLSSPDCENLQDDITLKLHSIMLHLKKSLSFKINHFDNRPSTLEDKLSCYITSHIQEKFDVDTICKTFFISVSKLNKIFREKFNCTPYQYYQSIRFNISKKMLKETDLSIDDIAARLNFVDRNHFSKFFNSREGISPASYRKKN